MSNTENQYPKGSNSFSSRIPLSGLQESVAKIKKELKKVLVGQNDFIELLIVSLLAKGHVLIEGVPGVAKTLTVKLLAKTLETGFSRIQFTPDLMPSDILGTSVLNMKTSEFEFKAGPIFSNLVLIDEINRAPAKTQSALFEVMEEQQITNDGLEYKMKSPFMVLATQNPIEQEGTYPLPEAQLDRFLFKIQIGYPTSEEEVQILSSFVDRKGKPPEETIDSVISGDQLTQYNDIIHNVMVEERIVSYIVEIIARTRSHSHLYLGASPRASLAVLMASKTFAAMDNRDFVLPEDVKKSIYPALRHRILLIPEREMEGMDADKVIEMILQSVEIPR